MSEIKNKQKRVKNISKRNVSIEELASDWIRKILVELVNGITRD